jgi:hypothetical protein
MRARRGWSIVAAALALALALAGGARPGLAAPTAGAPPTARPPTPVAGEPAWTTDERSVFDFVRARYLALGVKADLAAVTLEIDDRFAIPFYQPGVARIFTMRFARDLAGARRHIASVSATMLGGLMVLDRFRDGGEVLRGYRALLVSAMAHELAHAIYFARPGAAARTRLLDLLDVETEAMELELAFMDHLVARGDLDRSWRAGVDRVYAAFTDAIPAAAWLPDGGHGDRALGLFTDAYLTTGASLASLPAGVGTPAIDASFRRIAGYMMRRAELIAGPRRSIEELVAMVNARHAAALAAGPPLASGTIIDGPVAVLAETCPGLPCPEVLTGVTAIASNAWLVTLAIKDGRLLGWGAGGWGRLGPGLAFGRTQPLPRYLPTALDGFTAVSTARAHALALGPGGAVCARGDGTRGALGTGGDAVRDTPTLVTTP